jgi:hypothetical protein
MGNFSLRENRKLNPKFAPRLREFLTDSIFIFCISTVSSDLVGISSQILVGRLDHNIIVWIPQGAD